MLLVNKEISLQLRQYLCKMQDCSFKLGRDQVTWMPRMETKSDLDVFFSAQIVDILVSFTVLKFRSLP